MASNKLHLRITTPEGNLFEGDVDDVVLPAVNGEMDVLPMHAAQIAMLLPGELIYRRDGQAVPFAIDRGLAEIQNDVVSVLTEGAFDPDNIDEAEVEAAIERAREAANDPTLTAEDQDAARSMLAKSIAQIHVKKKWRG